MSDVVVERMRALEARLGADEPLLDAKAAAEVLGVSPRMLERWRLAGTGPVYLRLGLRCVRYARADLRAWIERRKVEPGKDVGKDEG